MKLTAENYYSLEANQEYMSVSQYHSFLECEAKAMAQIYGGWEEPKSEAFLIGSYVHAWSEGTLDKFKTEHEELFSSKGPTKGELKATYKIADAMIETLKADPAVMYMLDGDKEVIMTAEFAGCTWKCKVDIYNPSKGRIVDLKTAKSLTDRIFTGYLYEPWIVAYGHINQLSVYAEIERIFSGRENYFEPLLVAVTKEDPPDHDIFSLDDPWNTYEERIRLEIEKVELAMPRILQVKNRVEKPKRCGKCRYCRETKKVEKIRSFMDL
jgi:hypothetical protein